MVRYVPRRAERSEGAPKGKEKAMSQAGTIIRGEGERLWFAGGGLWTMKATAEETDAGRPPDLDRLRAAAKRPPDTIEILGPPPFEAAREESASKAKA